MLQFDRALPENLRALHTLALDLRWSWNHALDELWRQINADIWSCSANPILVLQLTSDQRFAELARDANFIALLNEQQKLRDQYFNQPTWFQTHYAGAPIRCIAYFSMEFGICDALPLYAGGLGMLAGDYLKTASDLGLPLVGVGLLYQEGYFHQSVNKEGWQQETYLYNDPGTLPLQPLRAEDGSWLAINAHFLGRDVYFRVWLAQVGRVNLYLLDSNDPRNQPIDRGITSKLYGGNQELRMVQEIALGVCGWRLLHKLGLEVDICHLNEGHAAFATLERIRSYCKRNNCDFWQGLWATRMGNLFTTHTPVEAGFDRYPADLLRRYAGTGTEMGVTIEDVIALGRANPNDENEPFNMAWLAMRTCANSNGVSALHGAVSRRIFQPLFPRWPEREVPLGHVTNGVHVPTWHSPEAEKLWIRVYGELPWQQDWTELDPHQLDAVSDEQLWQVVNDSRGDLVDHVRSRLAYQWRQETSGHQTHHHPAQEMPLSPGALTLGFARRFAEYKRPDLLLTDPDRLERLLCNPRYPVQLIVAGKAHPADGIGKEKIQRWNAFLQRESVRNQVVFVEDYDIDLAQHLVRGVDLWINNPRRPWEASGTSGMKILANGGVNLSSLDGWWAEAYTPAFGWALGDGKEHGPEEDAADAAALYQHLEKEVIPLFYQRDHQDLPRQWLAKVRASMAKLTPRFSCNRMLKEYLEQFYLPAAQGHQARNSEAGALARELREWELKLHQHWHEIRAGDLQETEERFHVSVHLGGIAPNTVKVQLVAESLVETWEPYHPGDQAESPGRMLGAITLEMELEGKSGADAYAWRYSVVKPQGRPRDHFTARVIPFHPAVSIPGELPLISWQNRS